MKTNSSKKCIRKFWKFITNLTLSEKKDNPSYEMYLCAHKKNILLDVALNTGGKKIFYDGCVHSKHEYPFPTHLNHS